MDYRSLDPDRIVETVEALRRRIEERFPGSGLGRACGQLLETARKARERAAWISRPNLPLRAGIAGLILLIASGLALSVAGLRLPLKELDFAQFIQMTESGINDVVLVGAALFFLVTLETRLKRSRALKALHELRAMAHIVDMHQLTKDPERMLSAGGETPSSPKRRMTPFELSRYLDYCSEMLSMAGKIAALYVQDFDDPVALAAVREIEDLTTGLSRKIWQKLMVLHSVTPQGSTP